METTGEWGAETSAAPQRRTNWEANTWPADTDWVMDRSHRHPGQAGL